MPTVLSESPDSPAAPETAVRARYRQVLDAWNARDAAAFAALFTEDGAVVGFDGSQMSSRAAIAAELHTIFTDHVTPPYVGKVRDVRLLGATVALLQAVVGMVPPGQTDLAPALNAIQTLVATQQAGTWQIALLQTTPAQFHGRPEAVAALTDELRALL